MREHQNQDKLSLYLREASHSSDNLSWIFNPLSVLIL